MIPELDNGTPKNRALLEDLLVLLVEAGFDIHLFYLGDLSVDQLVADIIAVIEHKPLPYPPPKPLPPAPSPPRAPRAHPWWMNI